VLGVFSARLRPPALSSKWFFSCAHLRVLSSPSLFRGTLFARFSVPFLRCVSVLARVGVSQESRVLPAAIAAPQVKVRRFWAAFSVLVFHS